MLLCRLALTGDEVVKAILNLGGRTTGQATEC